MTAPSRGCRWLDASSCIFTGDEDRKATIVIHNGKIGAKEGHHGEPDLRVTVDTQMWLRFLISEKSIVWALLRGKLRLEGSPKLLIAFGECVPS